MADDKAERKVIPAPFARRQPVSDGKDAPGGANARAEDDARAAGGKVARRKEGRAVARRATPPARGDAGAVAEPLATRAAAPATPRRRKRGWLVSLLLVVLLPTLLTGLYYFFYAKDQYMVETRFAVRSANPAAGSTVLASLGLGMGDTSTDTYIIMEYIHSREILSRIDRKLDLRARYRKAGNDPLARLAEDASFEDFLDYWRWMVQVHLDRISHIITVNVFAFTPQDARDIAQAILTESERMVNELSVRAREDAVAYAAREVAKAEERLRQVRQKFLQFRNQNRQIDPARHAQVQVALIGKLEEQLSQLRAKLAEARSYLRENAPTVVFLRNRIRALEKQIQEERDKLGSDSTLGGIVPNSDSSLSQVLSEYEALLVEREFAEKFYLSALSSLEQARVMASRQQRYLATFVLPYLPEEAEYPRELRNTFFVFVSLLLLWALGLLMAQSIRDRM